MNFAIRHPDETPDPRAAKMLNAMGGFPCSDIPMFLAGYSELCRNNLTGGHAVEICGGFGHLAAAFSELMPDTKVEGLDLYEASGPEVEEAKRRCPNLNYVAGDAFDLSRYADNTLDLVWGQAALHHLAHAPGKLAQEVLRVLKPGGRLVFIFEPLGHNLLVAAIRAMRMAKYELGDESNLYLSQFEMMSKYFSSCEVQIFNLLAYPMKAVSDRLTFLSYAIQKLDSWLFRKFPKLMRYGANCNVIFTK